MYFLGTDYIVSSLLWLTLVAIFVFTFRKPIMKLLYKKATLDLFISKLKIYLEKTYPDIKFDYSIVDNIIDQFKRIELNTSKYPKNTPKELHWGSYMFNCEPNKDKLPKDWMQRKMHSSYEIIENVLDVVLI